LVSWLLPVKSANAAGASVKSWELTLLTLTLARAAQRS